MKNNVLNKGRILLLLALFITLMLLTYSAFGQNTNNQQHQIRGVVTDSEGIPVPGVHVLISGTQTGTFTDSNGTYSISPHPTDVLIFSYVGFDTVEKSIGGQTEINVTLKESVTDLGAVTVNAGYYTVSEKERTGSISRITASDIETQPVINPLQALQGRMPGVIVSQISSIPGSTSSIQIRGQNSLRPEGNYPLYIVDGVPVSSVPVSGSGFMALGVDPLNSINLSNIESIEVLKDADATSIYGSRGANGVVLITTKKGREGKTALDIGLYTGMGKISNTINTLDTNQYLEMRKEAFANDEATPTQFNAPDLLVWDQNRNTDWQEKLLGNTSYITDVQASVSGGDTQTSFLLGGGFHKEGTVFPGDFNYRKATGFINLNHSSSNHRFRVNFSANYGVDRNHLFYDGQFVQRAVLLAPNAPALYDLNGQLNWEGSTWTNPLSYLEKTQETKTNNLIANASLAYEIIPNLNLKTSFGYTNLHSEEISKEPLSSRNPALWQYLSNSSRHITGKRESIILEPQLTYSLQMGKGSLKTLLGMSYQKATNHQLYAIGVGYADESLIGNLATADRVNISLQDDIEYKYHAAFGRIGFDWAKKYFLNLTGRRDGSSRFATQHRFASFGAVGAAWIFSEEPFVRKTLPFLSFGKIRGSYGTTGNDQIADYGYLDIYAPTQGSGGLYPTQIANPEYSWEVNKKLEIATSLGAFEDRVMVSGAWYRNRSSNQLVGYFLPAITGFTSIQANLPAKVENIGWEIELSTRNIRSSTLQWDTSVNITFPKNELVSFPGLEQSSYANIYREGASLNSSLLYQSLGVNPETGFYEILDANSDGSYNSEDKIIVKDFGRKYYGGINNNLTLGGFTFNFFIEFVKQLGRNHLTTFQTPPGMMGFVGGNQPVEVRDRWQLPGDFSNTQKFSQAFGYTPYNRTASSDLSVTDASYVRLKTLTLSYQLPPRFMYKTGIESCRVYLHAQNLFTITNYSGFDPANNRGSLLALPPLRIITIGTQLKF
ncbi:SusC/RagA family TonB-linked outer membrane protein [Zhouia spongiae]|uniref:SusC/RagA family TonB-linked outer membrane protein n=1 Tax=Zhouia spongiae TaxID=2202721 RepID=A0ABY3YLE0_9FLAO|nr:SusC/RagA family TonB-linked outer membrane protein [Zhouia spongiae]UNY98614.1 SusC/RagA family TonB-linked outer membrane protein [Zhouia spongiae]